MGHEHARGGIASDQVEMFHQPEIGRLVVIFVHLAINERVPTLDLEHRVVAALMPDR